MCSCPDAHHELLEVVHDVLHAIWLDGHRGRRSDAERLARYDTIAQHLPHRELT
jgi:hypothetical protein